MAGTKRGEFERNDIVIEIQISNYKCQIKFKLKIKIILFDI